MRQSNLMSVIKQFLKTTTLHGFKYLSSPHSIDRVGWAASCALSVVAAGALCAALWARFQQVPALLVLRDAPAAPPAPHIALCPRPDALAHLLMNTLTSKHSNETAKLRSIVGRVIGSKPVPAEQLVQLERFLSRRDASLVQTLLSVLPPCEQLVRECRWERAAVPCAELFYYRMTAWGLCCIMDPNQRSSRLLLEWDAESQTKTKTLELIIECYSVNSTGCEFFTKYAGQETVEVTSLLAGVHYNALVVLAAEKDADRGGAGGGGGGGAGGGCRASRDYSVRSCNTECLEKWCGCSDPLLELSYKGRRDLPHCNISKLLCVRASSVNRTCNCLPRCKKVFVATSIEASPINGIAYSIDPLSAHINLNTSTALYIRMRSGEARFYYSIATETWITLLASLGGVFNMFLGVGMFSALEVLYLIFVQIPKAISRPTDLYVTPAPGFN